MIFFLGGGGGGGEELKVQEGKIFRLMKMLVFAMTIVFQIFLGLGVKLSRWGKNSFGG